MTDLCLRIRFVNVLQAQTYQFIKQLNAQAEVNITFS